MVLPASLAAARDAEPVREALARRASLVELWLPAGPGFAANVHVCVALLEIGAPDPDPNWTAHVAGARGVPDVELTGSRTVADLGDAVAGFRDEYYGLVDHVHEAGAAPDAPLVTSGCIDVASCAWGSRSVRFAKRRWERPEVDREGLVRADPRIGAWVDRLRRPKVVVASQTRVLEAAVDPLGTWVPVTPVVSVLPDDPADLVRIAAALCSPPVAAWAVRRAAGSGLSATAIRVSTALVLDAPLPTDATAWDAATHAFDVGDLATYGRLATAMHDLPGGQDEEILAWWMARLPRP